MDVNAYYYPLKGIYYLLGNRTLWPPLRKRMWSCLVLSAVVLAVMFSVAYLPQLAVLAIFNGPLAVVSAAGLVLSESSFIVNQLARAFIIEDSLVDLFDATLIEQGCAPLVSRGRELRSSASKNAYSRLGRMLMSPVRRLSPQAIGMYLLALPLNLIPVVGTLAFLVLQGYSSGPKYHARYFQLKGLNEHDKASFISSHRGAYTAFGTTAAVLNLVPFSSIPLAFTHSVGAALWAANLEKTQSKASASVVTRDRDL